MKRATVVCRPQEPQSGQRYAEWFLRITNVLMQILFGKNPPGALEPVCYIEGETNLPL